jgi:beta-barrel assembly-enhancing protease
MPVQRLNRTWLVLLFFLLAVGFSIPRVGAMSVEEEKILGRKIFLEIERSGDLLSDPPVEAFLERVGQRIVSEVGNTPFTFKFCLVKAQEPNAFAIPGGYVFVTTGLLVMAENEDEVAGVLSHEVAHVTMRHISHLIDRSKRFNIASMVGAIAAIVLGGGGAGSQAMAAGAMAASEALMLKYTRENETDADQNGLHYLVKAGYDSAGLLSFLKKLIKLSMMAPKIPTYLSTHPATGDRIALLENLIQIENRSGPGGVVHRGEAYKWVQARAFVEEHEPQVAVAYFESILKSDPREPLGGYGLGLAHRKAGRLDKSIEALEKGLSSSPGEPHLLRELGIGYFLLGRTDEAITALELQRSAAPGNDAVVLCHLGRAYLDEADFARALEMFQKARKEAPEYLDVYHGLGSVYGRMGRKGESHFFFGKYFLMKGDRNSALLHFRTALETLDGASPERQESQKQIKELTKARP